MAKGHVGRSLVKPKHCVAAQHRPLEKGDSIVEVGQPTHEFLMDKSNKHAAARITRIFTAISLSPTESTCSHILHLSFLPHLSNYTSICLRQAVVEHHAPRRYAYSEPGAERHCAGMASPLAGSLGYLLWLDRQRSRAEGRNMMRLPCWISPRSLWEQQLIPFPAPPLTPLSTCMLLAGCTKACCRYCAHPSCGWVPSLLSVLTAAPRGSRLELSARGAARCPRGWRAYGQ